MQKRGRKPGYKHSDETKAKMRESHKDLKPDVSTKEKMRQSKLGRRRPEEDRKAIATGRAHADLESKCLRRFLEMRSEYPGQEEFFDGNRKSLLIAMRDVKSETELRDIRRYIETATIDEIPQSYLEYQYDSSSIYAHESAMVDLVDAASFLRKALRTKDENTLLH